MMMPYDCFIKASPILYQNRYCDQKEFGIILSAIHETKERKIYKVKYPSFTDVEILHSTSEYSDSDKSLTSSFNIWTIPSRKNEKFEVDNRSPVVKSYLENDDLWNKIVQLPGKRRDYCT